MEMEMLAGLSHLFVTVFLYNFTTLLISPATTDVTMAAVCPGKNECSLAIYLSGIQQAIIGLGTVVTMPLIGNLSDVYGRKALLTVPMTSCIIPFVILACSRTTNFFYAYYVLKTLAGMISDGSVLCLALAYVADKISEEKRTSAFAILSGVVSAAYVCGTLAARFLSTAQTFQVAAFVSMFAIVYMRVFLKDTICTGDALTRPILKSGSDNIQSGGDSSRKIQVYKNIPSPKDLICLFKSSITLTLAAFVAFFGSLADGGLQASLLYFLKARFLFDKDQFAYLMLITNFAGAISQLLFMPMLAPIIGEERLLSVGAFVGSLAMLIYSLAWSAWVPYAVDVLYVFIQFTVPCLRSIVSKQVGPNEQGMAQGCIESISSLANIISPLVYSPLTALFLSKGAPFHFPGFSIMCVGLAWLMAFITSTMIKPASPISSNKGSNDDCLEA